MLPEQRRDAAAPRTQPAIWLRRLWSSVNPRQATDVSATDLAPPDESYNGRMLRLEGIFASISLGSVSAFYALFAIQLGASNAVVGWLTSAPALVSLLIQIPISRLIPRFRSFRTPIIGGVALQRLLIMGLAGVVWLPAAWRPWAVVALVALAAAPTAMWGVAFQSAWVVMFSPRRLAQLVGLRWAYASVSMMFAVYLLGAWLDLIAFPRNFQFMFLGVGVISLASVWVMARFRFPALSPAAPPAADKAPGERLNILGWARRYRPFFTLEATAFVAYLAIYGAMPLFRIYWVRDLEATGAWIGILTAASSVGGALGCWLWGRWSHPKRNRRSVLITCLGAAALYPLLTAAFDTLAPLVVVNLLAGFVSGGNELMILNRSMELAGREHLPTFVAIYALTVNAASFISPLATTFLTDQWGARAALVFVAGVGLLGAGLIFGLGWGKAQPAGNRA